MSLFSKFSRVSRERKLELLAASFPELARMSVLDIGSQVDPDCSQGLQFIDRFMGKVGSISAVNIDPDHVTKVRRFYPQVAAIVGDACDLPWPDKSFDLIYSNAVIEHVGDFERQQKMASEVMRVGKNWFVTTPNRRYPFEFHMRVPFITWLPCHGYLWAGRIVRYNHDRKRYKLFAPRYPSLRLLTSSEMGSLFPGSRIIKQRVTFWPETIIAIGGSTLLGE